MPQVTLDEHPVYDALSYVWEDPTNLRSIWLSGHSHPATANLEIAPRHLRKVDAARILWVDALCINQADLKERELRVKHMNRIYKQARRVIGWVGEASEDNDDAVKFIRKLGMFAIENQNALVGGDDSQGCLLSLDLRKHRQNILRG